MLLLRKLLRLAPDTRLIEHRGDLIEPERTLPR